MSRYIYIILIFNFLLRLITIYIFGDKSFSPQESNEWGVIFENLKNYGVMSWFEHDDFKYPTVFMPPFYVFYIYSFSFLQTDLQILSILISQSIIAIISSFIFYKICNIFFDKKFSTVGLILFSFYPIYIYASSQISSINLVIFINLYFIYCVLIFRNIFIIGLLGGVGLLLRGEFIILYFISIIYLFIIKSLNLKQILSILILSLIIVSPYLVRNFIIFNKVVITNSTGYVLWRGNNSLSTVDSIYADKTIQIIEKGVPENFKFESEEIEQLYIKLQDIKYEKKYDVLRDDIFLDQAKKNILENPVKYLKLYLKKFASFLFINFDSNYPGYYNYWNIIPEIFISILGIIGILLSLKEFRKFNYIYFYLFYILSIYSVFLILPRYKLVIIPCLIIFGLNFVKFAFNYFKNNIFLRYK